MAKAKEIVVDGKTYIEKGSVTSDAPKNSDIKIVILQRGWVMVGRYKKTGDSCSLDNAYVIRKWGTTKGLGELALSGPQSDTTLDKAGRVEFHVLTIVATINCVPELWKQSLV